jgi:hypothetical protein
MYVCMYVFVGVGFPMHCDLMWSTVRPLPENSGTNPSGGDMVNFLDGKCPSGSLWELGVLLRAVNLLHGSNSLKSLPKDFVPEFFRHEKFDDLRRD